MHSISLLQLVQNARAKVKLTFKVNGKERDEFFCFREGKVLLENGVKLSPNKVAVLMNGGKAISSNKNIFVDGKSLAIIAVFYTFDAKFQESDGFVLQEEAGRKKAGAKNKKKKSIMKVSGGTGALPDSGIPAGALQDNGIPAGAPPDSGLAAGALSDSGLAAGALPASGLAGDT